MPSQEKKLDEPFASRLSLMAAVAVLGTGLLGAGFVRGFRKRGVEVNCWNRTAEKAKVIVSPAGFALMLVGTRIGWCEGLCQRCRCRQGSIAHSHRVER